ncbi:MAG: tyrosine-type recombinase/integrase [Blautia sp.]|nr:tyrosine-type recombinase/integrase [Blautia sp.]
MRAYKSFLAPLMKQYQEWRKALGTWSDSLFISLLAFDNHCLNMDDGKSILTQDMVNKWFHKRESETNNSCRARVNPSKGFLVYLISRNLTEIVLPDIPKWEKSTYVPTILSENDLTSFFYECDHIPARKSSRIERHRKMTIPVIFRLLYSSGMRPYEARWLKKEDVELDTGIVNINKTKRGIQHRIVLHDSMLLIMKEYNRHIQVLYPNRSYFFPGFNGECLTARWLRETFKMILMKSGCPTNAVPYSFRHSYATENLNSWDGTDPDFFRKFVMLSKSMGHTGLKSTQYYYQEVPKYYELIEEKTKDGMDFIIPDLEVDDEI